MQFALDACNEVTRADSKPVCQLEQHVKGGASEFSLDKADMGAVTAAPIGKLFLCEAPLAPHYLKDPTEHLARLRRSLFLFPAYRASHAGQKFGRSGWAYPRTLV